MSDSLIFYWIANDPKIERYNFKTRDGTDWSFGRVSTNLNESPTLVRENNKHKDQLVRFTIDGAVYTAGKIKRYLSFSKNRMLRKISMVRESSELLWLQHPNPIKLQIKFTMYPVFDFQVVNVDQTCEVDTYSSDVVLEKLQDLSMDIEIVLKSGHLSDVVLTNGSKEIKAHKVILAARSPVFQRMFAHPLKENVENRVHIADIDDLVLHEIISFMYTGRAHDMCFSLACDVYAAADKYAIDGLKDICSELLNAKLSLETVVDLIIFTFTHNEKELKEKAMHFLYENFAKIKESEGWVYLSKNYPNLYTDMLTFIVDKLVS